jgi:hypothetical protein
VSLNFQATRFRCSWPWETGGPAVRRPGRLRLRRIPTASACLGDAPHHAGGRDLDRRDRSTLRRDLNAGGSTFCGDCPLKLPLADDEPARVRPLEVGPGGVTPFPSRPLRRDHGRLQHLVPRRLLRARDRITKTRQAGMLDRRCSSASSTSSARRWPASTSSTTAKPSCTRRRSRCARWSRAAIRTSILYTSTNGGRFTEDRVRQLVRAGLDEMTFSLDGASQDVYVRYRQRGSFEKSTAMMRAADRREAPARTRRAGHQLALHPLQLERHDREMARAPALAAEWGVDRLCWEITDHPSTPTRGASRRHRGPRRDPPRDLGRQQPRQRDPRRHARARIELRGAPPGARLHAAPGETVRIETRVRNLSQRPFAATATYGRRHVRLGASSRGPTAPS